MGDQNYAKLHIAMLPWLAFGHLIPFLELAKLLASKGHNISFISTSRNIDRLPQIPQTLTPFIQFIKINLPKALNLPENADSTKDLPFNKVKYLKLACDRLQTPLAHFLETSSPDWIMCDFVTYWVGPIAAERGIRSAYFSVFPALMLCFAGTPEVAMHGDDSRVTLEDFVKRPKWVSFQSEVRPSMFQLIRGNENFNAVEENVSDAYRLGATVRGCDAVIWLDMHEKGSVVYIAFGTETKPSQYELTQLALGLELCGLPFYWVLIDQRGVSDDDVIELPCGFEERTRGRGVVCRGWAPQFKILNHDSVGGLLIHSGMSSVVEGFQLGKPLVLLPFLMDQGLIASYLVEKKMAYMIHREDVDGSFTPESVADSLSLVMVREEGKMYREKAKEMMGLFGDRDVQDDYVDDLIRFLQT
ncbi:putative soyasaponin III rhamnosyltransferase [Helianthus annuus]|nr:putative soyasaponin III rhamnosyltransferase [Helianthus annuus]